MIDEIKNRRAIREYQDTNISKIEVKELIEAALMAPSPFNLQPWKFYIVRDKEKKKGIRSIYDESTRKIKMYKKLCLTNVPIYEQDTSFLETATLIVPCYEIKIPYARDSLGMAVQNLCLEATRRNIGSVCMGRPTKFKKQRKQMKNVVGTGKDYEIPYLIAVGYLIKALEQYEIPERKLIGDVTIQL